MQPHDTTNAQYKTCNRCCASKPLREFHRKRNNKDGYRNICKRCRSEAEGFRYHPPVTIGYCRCSECGEEFPADVEYFYQDKRAVSGFSSRCRVCTLKCSSEWYKRNREKALRRSKEWAINNPDKVEASQKKHYSENRLMIGLQSRVKNANQKATEFGISGLLSTTNIEHQYELQNGKCHHCGRQVDESFHIDHVIPMSRGGTNLPENIVISCPSCNCSKGNAFLHEWDQENHTRKK